MLAPDVQFMVHSSEYTDEEGRAHRGSSVKAVEKGQQPTEWILRDFAFAAYSSAPTSQDAQGLREIHFGRRSIWAFASPHEHCEEIVIFRCGQSLRRKWEAAAMHEPKMGLDAFYIMRMKQIDKDTPLSKQFNGEWGFWESFFVPIVDDAQTLDDLSLMDADKAKDFYAPCRLAVTRHKCPQGQAVLAISDDMVVKYEVTAEVKDMEQWTEFLAKLGEDMLIQDNCMVEDKFLKPGDECVAAFHDMVGMNENAQLRKRNIELLKLPATLKFLVEMHVTAEWRPDLLALQNKVDDLNKVFESNLMGGFSYIPGSRPDPWTPINRLCVNALNKVLARYPNIRSMMDVGCGDMAWMQYFLYDNTDIQYVGVDMCAIALAINFKRFPLMQFLQTDCANLNGIEIMPKGLDLIVAKDFFNTMSLPDAVNAMKRIVNLRPRFLLTHIDTSSDNSGWETRIGKHREKTPYNYNAAPFCIPFPVAQVQQISENEFFVLYEISPGGNFPAPPLIENMEMPSIDNVDAFTLVIDGEMFDADEAQAAANAPSANAGNATKESDELGPMPIIAKEKDSTTPVAEVEVAKPVVELKPVKGIPAAEFRARCDLIFEKYDQDQDQVLNYEELVSLMDSGGRRIEEYDAYASLCGRLGVDARVGLSRKDVYKLFEKAPQSVWEEVYRSINPLAQMVCKGVETLPESFLERPLANFLYEDDEQYAKVYIELNAHLYYGAAEVVTEDHIKAFFGKQRIEVHIAAPGSYGAQDLYIWKLIITPLFAEIVPEDCTLQLKVGEGRFGSKKILIKLMKSKKKKWAKVGQAATGAKI